MSESSTCPYCGGTKRRPSDKRCGKPECKKAFNRERQGPYVKAYEQRLKVAGRKRKPSTVERTCVVCGITFNASRRTQAHCSPECWRAGCEGRRHQRCLPVLHENPAPYTRLPANHPVVLMQARAPMRLYVMGWCKRCGDAFVIVDQLQARYCSLECTKKAGRHTRRLRKYGSGREPYCNEDIYTRDGWRCHLCGRKVKRTNDYTRPLSPTVDHLIPLSRGGLDAPSNLACAHRLCNSVRSDIGAAQLILFG